MTKLKEYLIGDHMYHKAKDVENAIAGLEKLLHVATMKADYCERNHKFCPDCRDKIGSEEGCPRCKIQKLGLLVQELCEMEKAREIMTATKLNSLSIELKDRLSKVKS